MSELIQNKPESQVVVAKIIFAILGIVIGVVATLVYVSYRTPAPGGVVLQDEPTPGANVDCTVKEGVQAVNSESQVLAGSSSTVVLQNYYACQSAKVGDIVAYHYAGSTDPLVKAIKGVPGDSLELKKNGTGWNILINQKAVQNSEGKPYLIGDSGYRMLSLYVTDYKGIIPSEAYLILDDNPAGGFDSTRFGLVSKNDFVGKVKK